MILLDTRLGELGMKLPVKCPEIPSRQPVVGRRKVNQDTSRLVSAECGESFDDAVQISQCRSPRVRQDGEQVYCNA